MHAVLRRLPDRKAPSSLEGRVLAELSRRAALPWWRKSFAHWPSAVRLSFVLCSALAAFLGVSGLVALAGTQGAHQVTGNISNSLAWLILARDVVASFDGKARQILAAVPPLWLYGVAGGIALCYAALAAIGAATYRAITFSRQTT